MNGGTKITRNETIMALQSLLFASERENPVCIGTTEREALKFAIKEVQTREKIERLIKGGATDAT